MINLYYWPTPNARKVSILFEELKLKYNLIKVDINKGEQFFEKFFLSFSALPGYLGGSIVRGFRSHLAYLN